MGSGFSFDQWLIESDRAGRPVEMLDPQGRTSTYHRDLDGTLTEKVLSGSSGPVDTWAYKYDALDRVVSRTRSGADARTESFHYDQAGRLDVVAGQQVGYDPNGNRTSNGGSTTTFRADNSVLTAGADTYTQTPFGAVDAAGCRNNDYDGFDRLASVDGTSCATSSSTSFTYDGIGRQIQVTTTGTDADTRTLRYVGESGTVFSDIGNAATDSARYVNTPAGQPVAVSSTETTPTIQGLHSDGQQNTVLATSPSAVACPVDLDPWGEPRDDQSGSNPCQAGDSPANRWWNHGRRDVGTGTYTFGARTYDPTTATWLQPDNSRGPAAPTDLSIGTDPMLANRYSYVNGDPVNLIDPTGHYACTTQRAPDGGCGYGEHRRIKPAEGALNADGGSMVRDGYRLYYNEHFFVYKANRLVRMRHGIVEFEKTNEWRRRHGTSIDRAYHEYMRTCRTALGNCYGAASLEFGSTAEDAERFVAFLRASDCGTFCDSGGALDDELTQAIVTGVLTGGVSALGRFALRRVLATAAARTGSTSALAVLADDALLSTRWTRSFFGGNRVYQRDDLIDPTLVDPLGRTNLQRMQDGLAPLGPDGRSINLHHLTQRQTGAIAEVSATMHQQYSRVLHINPRTIPSGIERRAFDAWRSDYWEARACDFGGC